MKIVKESGNVKLGLDEIEGDDGKMREFMMLMITRDTEDRFVRDEKGNLCYGRRPPRVIPLKQEDLANIVFVCTISD